MASLQRTVALEEVDHLTVGVAEDLHLNVPRVEPTYFSSRTRSSPNAAAASRLAPARAAGELGSGGSTLRMPLPPPPATALINTGQPIAAAASASRPGA